MSYISVKSGIISSYFVISMSASLFAENSSVPTNLINSKTAVTVGYTASGSLEGVSTTAGILWRYDKQCIFFQ